MSKPRYLFIAGAPVRKESALQSARRKCERDWDREPWLVGEGARYYTPERIAAIAAENEARRKRKAGK